MTGLIRFIAIVEALRLFIELMMFVGIGRVDASTGYLAQVINILANKLTKGGEKSDD